MDLLAQIDSWGVTSPERAAHVSEGRTLTYGELREKSDALAAWLADKLGDNRAPVAVIGHKEPEMLVAFLGVVKSGRPYVPIDLSIPAQRAERIVQNAGAALTLTPVAVREALENCRTRAPLAAAGEVPALQKPQRVAGDDPYYIIFTSGSTGEPKGVVITLNCLLAFVTWMLGEQKFAERGETFLNQAPFSFDLSVMDLYCSLATGGTLFSITKDAIANPKALYQQFAQSGLTTWVSTPSFAQMCLIEKSFAPTMLPKLRRFLFCGETLANDTAAALLERFPNAEVWNTYGPTEATVATTSIRVDREVLARHAPLPVGAVMPRTHISIMGENGAPVAEGERGEIVVIGPNVSPGYLGSPDLTDKAFFTVESTRGYRTGDWGRTRGGLIFFEGRMDGQIKLFGYRIELGDIESHLRSLPEIADAVVLPVEKGGRPDSLAGFVVLRERDAGSDFEIGLAMKKQLGERIPTYMVPRKFWFLDAFPMTPNGKADRRKLAEMLRVTPYTDFTYFGLLLYAVIPTIVLGLFGRANGRWALFVTIAFLVLQFDTPLVVHPGLVVSEVWIVLGYAAWQWAVAALLLRVKVKHAATVAIILSLLPLAVAKYLPHLSPQSSFGFFGISYVTFRALDVIFSIKDRVITALPPVTYFAFLFFFPTVSSGPIDRFRRFTQDWQRRRNRTEFLDDLDVAVQRLFRGFLYKFIIAALIRTHCMDPHATGSGLHVVAYMYAYTFYLFFDFAGYSAFAISLSHLLGVRTPENFNRPFLAPNIRDFWTRWHISLSFWFRDHIYMRFLLAAAKGKWFANKHTASYVGLFLTFGLMGVWHGTKWYYLLYGIYHAALLSGYDWFARWNKTRNWLSGGRVWPVVNILLTFHAVAFGLLLFSGRLVPRELPAREEIVEKLTCYEISGYVWDRAKPNDPAKVQISMDGQIIGEVTASQLRDDLLEKGYGNGRHGFTFQLPPAARDGREHWVMAVAVGAPQEMTGPYVIKCPPVEPAPARVR